ncbi:MAG: transcription factor WhiB [Pseudonocardiales bacterium]|nr:transcription factor WhiB [Pseudonocardiales bacterium]
MVHMVALPPLIDSDWRWRERSACREMGTEVFYNSEKERGPTKRARIAAAKSVCMSCPVRRLCLEWAVEVAEPYGVWGGTTPEERSQIRAQQTTPESDNLRTA